MVILRCKVVVVGNQAVGKTCLCKQYVDQTFSNHYVMTLGADLFNKKVVIPQKKDTQIEEEGEDTYNQPQVTLNLSFGEEKQSAVELHIFDISGSDIYRHEYKKMIENCNAFIVVYDVTNKESFNKIEYWIKLCRESREGRDPLIGCLVANKTDAEEFIQVQSSLGEVAAKKNQLEFFSVSALQGDKCSEPFVFIAEKFYKKYIERIAQLKHEVSKMVGDDKLDESF